jgi:hypothetical protein
LGVCICDGILVGEGSAEAADCVGRDSDGCGERRSDEHDKEENAKVVINKKTLVFTCKSLLIKLLLADRIPQHS